jgi:hypothetical protein
VYRLLSITVVVVLLSGFIAGPVAAADDKSCWVEAQNTTFLSIYDLDSLGSILSLVWEGVLAQGDKKHIISSNGKIRYYTNPNVAASSAGIDNACANNGVVAVP